MAWARIDIKGTKNGLLVTLGEGELASLLTELEKRLSGTASFFKGGQVALEVGPATRAAARRLGLETRRSSQPEPRPGRRAEEDFREGVLVRCTLRSGQIIRHPGHVVVIGDVNAGAEVIAGGDVVIWGRLRGTVHAGAAGDDHAIVCALELAPTQLRIGKHIARPPEGKPRRGIMPEVASVETEKIIVQAWKSSR
jgi:septum site-determining protein MinC